MAPGSRLDELTARYMQNPRRYFVPLANEYRKLREFDRAIALCREHLPSQPGHMSGHVVLARAYFDNGDLLAAREVFAIAVDLDDENLIALRHLGDIARARDEMVEARRWYGRVLAADPKNLEIEALLGSLDAPNSETSLSATSPDLSTAGPDGARGGEPASSPAEAAAAEVPPFETFDLATLIGLDSELQAVELPDAPRIDTWSGDDTPSFAALDDAPADDAPHAAVFSLDEAPPSAVASQAFSGIGFSFDDLDTLAEPSRIEAPGFAEVADDSGSEGHGLDLADDAATPSLIAPADEATAALPDPDESAQHHGFSALASFASWRTAKARDTPLALPLQPTPASAAPIAAPVFKVSFVDEPEVVDEEPPFDAVAPAPEFMTETMAVLYEQQGYTQQALDIYLALQRRLPDDGGISRKIVELQQVLAGATLSQASLQADADQALQYDDILDDSSSATAVGEAALAEVPTVPDDALETAFTAAWSAVPAVDEDAGDDWFAAEHEIEVSAETFTGTFAESDDMFGVSLASFGAPRFARSADPEVDVPAEVPATSAADTVPVVALASVFGMPVVGTSDATAADLLSVLAVQMVGRLPKNTPVLPVPDVLELPVAPAAGSGHATPVPLLSFDRFFSGTGPAPRIRVDTPSAVSRPGTPPAHVWPSLSPTFGAPPEAQAAASREVIPRPDTSSTGTPAQLVPEQTATAHPAPPAAESSRGSGESEPVRAPSSDFHRWLEGLS